MLQNYLKITFRILWRNKAYSIINISGLALGMAVCFFIFQYIRVELSYDRFHEKAADIYRAQMIPSSTATTHPGLAPALKADFPEVMEFGRLAPPNILASSSTFGYTNERGQQIRYNESDYYLADGGFLKMFSFPVKEGQAATALTKPNSIVLTETFAHKFFGNTSPIGKTMQLNEAPYTVTAILKDIPENSHVHFKLLVSLNNGDKVFGLDEWGWPEFYNYVQLAPGTDPGKIMDRMQAFTNRHMGERLRKDGSDASFWLQPLTGIHLHSHLRMEAATNGSEQTVWFLSILGLLILAIAWINYINLATAKSMERAREVGMRKVAGGNRGQLIRQFLMEALVLNTIALVAAAFIIFVAQSWFNTFTGKDISRVLFLNGAGYTWQFWLLIGGILFTGALLAGAYPAFVLSAFKPVKVLKGKFHQSGKGILLRKGLVTFQFTLSIILIAGAIIVYKQLMYMEGNDPGYDKDQLLIVKSPAVFDSTLQTKIGYFRNTLLQNRAIISMAASADIPGKAIFARNSVRTSLLEESKVTPFLEEIDPYFVPTYGMKLAAGRNLSVSNQPNVYEVRQTQVLLNETTVQRLGYASNEAAIGQHIYITSYWGDIKGEVIGVIRNYHQQSLRQKIEPIVYYHNNHSGWGYFSIRIKPGDLPKEISVIEKTYNQLFPGNAFDSYFLDEYFNRQYRADNQLGNIFHLFTILAIVIACLGLVGLSTYTIRLRTKEIGIRKILGSSTVNIVWMFSGDYMKLVALSTIIALPIVYFGAHRWLENYAFHITPGWWIFLAAPLVLLTISLLTTLIQTIKAALINPAKSLRNDS